MTEYLNSERIESAVKQRRKSFLIYFIVLFFYLAISVFAVVFCANLPYASPYMFVVKLVMYPLTALFIIFSFLYLGIVNKRVVKYYALVKRMSVGIKETSVAEFLRFDDTLFTKDGVDMKALIFSEWNTYKKEFYERKVGVFYETAFPELKEGKIYEFKTVGNVLFEYGEKESEQ